MFSHRYRPWTVALSPHHLQRWNNGSRWDTMAPRETWPCKTRTRTARPNKPRHGRIINIRRRWAAELRGIRHITARPMRCLLGGIRLWTRFRRQHHTRRQCVSPVRLRSCTVRRSPTPAVNHRPNRTACRHQHNHTMLLRVRATAISTSSPV